VPHKILCFGHPTTESLIHHLLLFLGNFVENPAESFNSLTRVSSAKRVTQFITSNVHARLTAAAAAVG